MEEQESSILDFREVLWKARRYKWLVLFPVVLFVCAACIFLIVTPPVYESAVVVSVDDHSPVSKEMNTLVGRGDPRYDENIHERVQRVDGKIHSRSFLEAIVDRTGLAKNPLIRQQAQSEVRNLSGITVDEYAMRLAVTLMGKQVTVTPQGETLIRIAAKGHDPRSARNLATIIGNELITQNKATSIKQATERGEFSADQIAVYEERLRKSEAAYQSYQQRVISHKLGGNPINETNYDAAKGVISETRAEMSQIRSRLETDLSAWQSSGGTGAGPPALGNSRTAELESRLSELETTYGLSAGHGTDETLKQKIGGVRQALYAEYQNIADGMADLSPGAREAAAGIALDRAELRSLKQKETRLSRLTGDFSHRLESQPTEELESVRLRTEVENNRELLQSLQKEATASHLSAALETSALGMDFDVLENPQLPLRPVFPDPVRILGIALFMGPLLGIGLAVLAERFGAALSSLEQAEREIGVRVVGTIPRIEGWSQPGGYVQKYWPVLSIALVLIATALFYTIHATVAKPDPAGIVQTKP